MKTLHLQQKNKGFTLIETLVALSIFVTSVTVLLVATGNGIQNTNAAQNRLTATYLAQEGVELVRAARDTYFMRENTDSNVDATPDMTRISRWCNFKISPCTDWSFNPTIVTNQNIVNNMPDSLLKLAGPLGPCNYVGSPADITGSAQGCNLNFQLETRKCTERMQLWTTLDPTKFDVEQCAEYFYNDNGIFRPKWTVGFTTNSDGTVTPNYPEVTDNAVHSGFSRQIFVKPSLNPDGTPDGGLRVTVRVFWAEHNVMKNVRIDDFLTGWPGTTVQVSTP